MKYCNHATHAIQVCYAYYTGMNSNDLADWLPSSLQSHSTNFEGVT